MAELIQREWTVRATSLCDVKTLRREDVTLMLGHFKEDAILVEKQVERHVAEMQKRGAIPAKKDLWHFAGLRHVLSSFQLGGVVADAPPLGLWPLNLRCRGHSAASNTSAQTEHSEGFRAAVGRALTGVNSFWCRNGSRHQVGAALLLERRECHGCEGGSCKATAHELLGMIVASDRPPEAIAR